MLSSSYALYVITCLWVFTLFLLGYWLRAVENTACQFGSDPTQPSSSRTTARHEGCQGRNARMWTGDVSVPGGKKGRPVRDRSGSTALLRPATILASGQAMP